MIEARSAPFVTRIVIAVSVVLGGPSNAQDGDQSWLDTSNALSTEVLSTIGDYVPEFASRQGLAEYDAEAMMIGAERDAAYLRALEDQATRLRERLDAEVDPNVRKDIGILLNGVELDIDRIPLEQELSWTGRTRHASSF